MCILSDAQLFLNYISGLIGASMIYRAFINKSQDVVDSYWRTQNSLFLSSFLGKKDETHKDEKDLNYFVMLFNALILELHIKAKVESTLFIPISPISFPEKKNCVNCQKTDFEDDGESIMCSNCGYFIRNCYAASWNDITRVYIAPVYTYNRRAQFKEYILQYQGKCIKIDYSILDKLLIPKSKICSKKEFLDILRTSIKDKFCIDNIHGLYYKFFSIGPPDLSKVTYNLLLYFDEFFREFNNILWEKRITNDKYISNQFLLYQFLNNNDIPTSLDDVLVPDVLPINNKILCEEIFAKLKWIMF